MAQQGPRKWLALGAAALGGSIISIDVALASQGPSGGMGTACHRTRMLMAAVVYGTTGLIAAVAMIGATRRHTRN
ncbi:MULTISPECIES: hypothetical protein [Bradyrhizobium]|uniref:hypothetical protein n=1 Tax=Bradyrhizobium TaxID=374 RepID=UPI00222766EF|nr:MULTISPECIES: hypothetical protein [Bradyrhizobium]MCW2354850.1 hypothetical protein [Bradyrhizobium elkanii]MDI2054953.1 hypothetical protein [Bradyrhizobium sp. Mp19]